MNIYPVSSTVNKILQQQRRGLVFSLAFLITLFTSINISQGALPAKKTIKHPTSTNSPARFTQNNLTNIAYSLQQPAKYAHSVGLSFAKSSVKTIKHHSDKHNGTPFFMDRDDISHLNPGTAKMTAGASPAAVALNILQANNGFFKLDQPENELRVKSEKESRDGNYHISFDQWYKGVLMWGQRLVVHIDFNGVPYAINGRYSPTPKDIDLGDIMLNETGAIERCVEHLSQKTVIEDLSGLAEIIKYDGPSAQLCIWVAQETREIRLTWHVRIRPTARDLWYYFIDVRDGSIIDAYNASTSQVMVSASALDGLGNMRSFNAYEENEVYYMADFEANIFTYSTSGKAMSENPPGIVTSTDNTWDDPIAVSGHSNTRLAFDYYHNTFGRMGMDGNGIKMPVIIHYTQDGDFYNNAFFAGTFFGYGYGTMYAAANDVVAHEYTHGVVQYTVGLEYKSQSGALNEGFADAFACMVDPDWELGEDLPEGAIRDVVNPSRFGLPEHMDDYREIPIEHDNGGVHINMSIPSRACYFVSEKIGRDKTARIWYGILDKMYLTPQSQFIDMRLAAVQSATDLFGSDSHEVEVVKEAFDMVGIMESGYTPLPVDRTPAEGDDYITFVYDVMGESLLMMGRPVIDPLDDLILLSETPVSTQSGSSVTIDREGQSLCFIDAWNNLRFLDLATMEEFIIDESGDWSSIALSPDYSRLAATSTEADSTIYIFDLNTPENSKAVKLIASNNEGPIVYDALYADALDWDSTGNLLLYDAFHQLPISGGEHIEFWDVNLLDVDNDIITRVKTPTEEGLQVANPTFAETNDRYIVCDLFSHELGVNLMVAIDLCTLELSLLSDNGFVEAGGETFPNMGYPRYSPYDSTIIFQQYVSDKEDYVIFTLPVAEDKMTPDGDFKLYIDSGVYPIWFVYKGEYTSVYESESTLPAAVKLVQNYPNPFNSVTMIPFTVNTPGLVSLTVYNLLGQEVETLVDKYLSAGVYKAHFDGRNRASGIYVYRLKTGEFEESRKMLYMK